MLFELYQKLRDPVVSVSDATGVYELFRCRADGRLILISGKNQETLARHAGHHFHQPVFLTLIERFVIWRSKSASALEKKLNA